MQRDQAKYGRCARATRRVRQWAALFALDAMVAARGFADGALDAWHELAGARWGCPQAAAECRVPCVDRRGRVRTRAASVKFTGGPAKALAAHFWGRTRTFDSAELEALWYRHGEPEFVARGALLSGGATIPFEIRVDFERRVVTLTWEGASHETHLVRYLPLDKILAPLAKASARTPP